MSRYHRNGLLVCMVVCFVLTMGAFATEVLRPDGIRTVPAMTFVIILCVIQIIVGGHGYRGWK